MNLFKTTILVCITLLITNSKLSAQLYINEICASNDNINIEGIFPDWIELYNSSNSAINLNGYTATDKINIPNLWTFPNISIPANSYLIIAANGKNTGLQTNFSLSAGGEEIAIFNNQGVLIDHVVFGPQTTDVSYGRITDGATEFVYFTNPTPGTSNNNAQGIRANNPEFSIDGGFYNSAVNLILSSNSSTARIFYTTDGSIPTQNSTEYIQPINISATTVIRAIVTDAGKANSTVSTHTYFLENRTFNLPVISISTDPDNFFGDRDGIYVEGTNGVAGYCMDYPVNWNQDWVRPVSFEIYDVSGILGVQVDAEAKIFGGCSRTNDMKSLRITARSEYGQNRIRYKFFENRKNDEFKSIVLRNSGNDWNITMLRDVIITSLSKDRMDLDYQEYQPAVVFINGEYWGIHNIRERIDKHFPANIYKNVDDDSVDVLERNGEIIDGDNTEYNQLIEFITNNSLANESNYATVANQIDINNYIDYMIIQIYVANTDWPGNNIKYWREKQDGKWRWILFDTDFGYGIWGDNPPDMNSLREALSPNGPDWPNPPWSTLLMRKLLENEGFKTQFLQRFAYHIHSTFSTERVEYIIDSLSSVINDEMYYHIERWGQPWDINAWYNNLDYIVTWNNDRTWYMMEHLMSRFRIANSYPVAIASDNENASVRMNDRKIKLPYSGEFFEGVPLVLSARTKNEVYFDHWQVNSSFGNEFFVTQGDTWKYNDMGVELPNDWKNIDYNENTWNSGTAPLGYSNSNDESTRLSYGADAENKHTTYYFRKSFNITNISSYSDFMLDIAVDDGAVVYINGQEVVRQNMPEGTISYNTFATSYDPNDGKVFSYYSISSNMFREGQNTIAVEVHQTSLNSSDVRFDARLLATYFLDTDQYVIYSNPWDINLNGSMAITLKTTNTPPIVTITEPLCNKIDNKTIVYPNPTKGIINIEGIDKNSKVTVKDILGKTIFSAHENRIDISQYPTGIYSVEILNNNSLQIFKVSKE